VNSYYLKHLIITQTVLLKVLIRVFFFKEKKYNKSSLFYFFISLCIYKLIKNKIKGNM